MTSSPSPPTPLCSPSKPPSRHQTPIPTPSSLRWAEASPVCPHDVQLNFYSLNQTDSGGLIVPRVAGMARAAGLLELPIIPAGLLQVLDQGRQRWAFDFQAYSGKKLELALYDSTCRPIPFFISPSEFIAFGCHGGNIRQEVAAFNLRGDATWEMGLVGSYTSPYLAFAPAAGRFALGRILTSSPFIPPDATEPGFFNSQNVDVYQDNSGKLLLHIDCAPIARAGQNFALSPDGMNIAVIREDAIEIFPLPPLTPDDKTAIKLAQDSTPPPFDSIFNLSGPSNSNNSSAPLQDPDDEPVLPPQPSPRPHRPTLQLLRQPLRHLQRPPPPPPRRRRYPSGPTRPPQAPQPLQPRSTLPHGPAPVRLPAAHPDSQK